MDTTPMDIVERLLELDTRSVVVDEAIAEIQKLRNENVVLRRMLKRRVAELTEQLHNERAYAATLEDRLELYTNPTIVVQISED
jgi:hypothetical protein